MARLLLLTLALALGLRLLLFWLLARGLARRLLLTLGLALGLGLFLFWLLARHLSLTWRALFRTATGRLLLCALRGDDHGPGQERGGCRRDQIDMLLHETLQSIVENKRCSIAEKITLRRCDGSGSSELFKLQIGNLRMPPRNVVAQ